MAGLIPLMLKPSPVPASSTSSSASVRHRYSYTLPQASRKTRLRPRPKSTVSSASSSPASSTYNSPVVSPTAPSFGSASRRFSMNRYSIISTQSAPTYHRRRPSSRLSTISEPDAQSCNMKRLSVPNAASLATLPSSPADWSRTLADVKRHFINRRFRQCAAKCTEILDNTRELTIVEPAHLIYLNFYAATALEQTARPMHASSPARTRLLRQARVHYCRAGELAREEDDSVSRASRRSSTGSRSSADSMYSRSTTTASTAVSSPTNSIYGPYESLRKAGGMRSHSRASSSMSSYSRASSSMSNHSRASSSVSSKKRVTFLDTELANAPQEPIIRPDSPTLGFDDWSPRSTPEPPIEEETPSPSPVPSLSPEPSRDELSKSIKGLFLPAGPFARYSAALCDMRMQIATHIAAIDAELAHSSSPISDGAADKAEMRALELRSRIERLRAKNWMRPRFDATPYATLRESVLAEL